MVSFLMCLTPTPVDTVVHIIRNMIPLKALIKSGKIILVEFGNLTCDVWIRSDIDSGRNAEHDAHKSDVISWIDANASI